MFKKTKNISDAKLVISYQSGDEKAFAILVKRWHLQFCKFAHWYVKDADMAKDIAQESWTTIYKKLHTLQQPERFKSWAISIVNRKAIDRIRAINREQHKLHVFYKDNVENASEIEVELDKNSTKLFLKQALEKLPNQQKVIVNLFYTQEYSQKEISELLGISIGTAKSRLFHAREKLKSVLKNKNYE